MPPLNSDISETEGAAQHGFIEKVKTIAELGEIAERLRAEGKTVVLCHGVFDLIHLGHVRHLEAAKREGDTLIVSITSDKFVNKGPDRPIFTEQLRAEFLSALNIVDFVGIEYGPSAMPVLEAIKPDAYVKGTDYLNASEDITGKIVSERETVEGYGGKVIFTDEITYSSSSLINSHFDVFDSPLRSYLKEKKHHWNAEKLIAQIESIADMKITIVGDAIIDDYQYVEPMGKSAKEAMISSIFKGREIFAGGVFAAANHIASFCREVEIVTTLGAEETFEKVIRESVLPNVKLNIIEIKDRPTTRKVRFLDQGHKPKKFFEVYHMNDFPVGPKDRTAIDDLIERKITSADAVIVTDFGHGLIQQSTVDVLIEKSPFLAVNAQTNSGNHGYNLITKYPSADFLCIDMPEARLAAMDKFSDIVDIIKESLPGQIDCDCIVVTHGEHGCYVGPRNDDVVHMPAFTRDSIDTVGAGDAFFSIASPLMANGANKEMAAFIGNAAGAMKVGIIGHRKSIDKVSLMKFVTTLLK